MVQIEAVLQYGVAFCGFDPAAGNVQVEVMITIGIEEYASHVFGGGGLIEWGDRFDDKLRPTGGGSAFVEIESTGAAGGATEEKVLICIAVDVAPGHARPGLG